MKSPEQLWNAYLRSLNGATPKNSTYSSWYFCDTEECANQLVKLVLAGKKRATASSFWSIELNNETVPQAGELSVITDWYGDAKCIIHLTSVDIVPFNEVSAEFAMLEGEGDGSLDFWRKMHWDFFTRELVTHNRSPAQDMPVVCEIFEVIYL